MFVACSARQLSAVTPAIIERDSAAAAFLGVQTMEGGRSERGRKDFARCLL